MMNRTVASLLVSAALAIPNSDASAQTTIPGFTLGNMEVSESGSASYTIPIQVPPGIGGMEPKIALDYNSNGGNGLVGMGWSLRGFTSIQRFGRTIIQDGESRAVRYDASDRLCYGGRLVSVSGPYGIGNPTEYRSERESFTNLVSYGNFGGGPDSMQLRNKSGLWMEFGGGHGSRVETQAGTSARAWFVKQIHDRFGNYIYFFYLKDGSIGEHKPQRIEYTGNTTTLSTPFAKVEFVWEARPDVIRKNVAGSAILISKRLKNIQTFVGTTMVKDYRLAYEQSPNTGRSRLTSVTECSGDGLQCLVPAKFTYHSFAGPDFQTTVGGYSVGAGGWRLADLFNIGRQLFYTHDNAGTHFANRFKEKKGNAPEQSNTWSTGAAGAVGDAGWGMGDLFGDGRQMFYTHSTDGTHRAIRFNSNGTFNAFSWTGGHGVGNAGWQLADLFGEGRSLYYTHTIGGTHQATRLNPGSSTAENFTWTGPGPANAADWKTGDPFGDGRQSIVYISGTTITALQFSPPPSQAVAQTWSWTVPGFSVGTKGWRMADLFGEGRQVLYTNWGNGTHYAVRLNSDGSFNTWTWTGTPVDIGEWELADIVGDGRMVYTTHSPGGGTHTAVRLNPDNPPSFTTWSWTDPAGTAVTGVPVGRFGMGDVFGTGRSVWYIQPGGDVHNFSSAQPFITSTQPADLLAKVSVGVGEANVTIDYRRLTDSTVYTRDSDAVYPVRDVQGPFYVVRQLAQNDGAGNSQQTTYSYAGAKTHVQGGGFLGFRKFDATSVSTGIKISNTFRQDYPFQGMPTSIVKTTAGGLVLSQVTNTYTDAQYPASVAGKHHRSDLTQSVTTGNDLSGTAVPSTTTTTTYDTYGNAFTINVSTSDGFTKLTTNTYWNNGSSVWILGRLTHSTVASTIPASMGGGTSTRTSGFEYSSSTGAILREAVEQSNSNLCLVTAYAYDGYGNKTSATTRNCNGTSSGNLTEAAAPTGNAVFAARTTTTQFQAGSVTIDGVVYSYGAGRFPTTTTNALNQSETRAFDPRFGGVLSLTGPNTLTTNWSFDKFGRKASESRADGTSTTWIYGFCGTAPNYCGHSLTETSTGRPTVTVHHDRLNRAWRKEVQGFDGTLVRNDSEFDTLGRTYRVSEPYYATASPVWTSFTYDILGRPTSQTNPLGGVTTKSYNALVTTTTNPVGQVETQTRNSQGQITRVTRQ